MTIDPAGATGNTPCEDAPEGCDWIGPWRQLNDPIWKWTRYYKHQQHDVIGCVERRESGVANAAR